jgi:ADP-heptose:LPS heptosyltransferase
LRIRVADRDIDRMMYARVENARRIAVLRAGALGDFIFTLPALDALRAAYPDAEIALLGKAWLANLLRERPGPIDRVVTVPLVRGVGAAPDAHEDFAALEAFFARMQAEHFDIALQLHGGGRYSNPFALRLGARVTAGLRAPDAMPLDRWMPYLYRQNERLRQLEAVALVGATLQTLVPQLAVTPRDIAAADAALAPTTSPLVVLQPGCTDPRRRWPADHFGALADALAARGARVAINGTASEAALVQQVRSHMQHDVIDLCGKLSLGALAGLMSRAQLIVSNDTGPLYLAQAVGAATVGIYWLENLANFGALFVTRHRHALSTRIDCPVCGRANLEDRCPHDESSVADVPLDAVLMPALELLGL